MCFRCCRTELQLTSSFSGYDDDLADALLDDHYDALGYDLEFAGWDSDSDD